MAGPKKPAQGAPEAKDDTEEFLEWLEGVPDPQERLSSVRANAASAAYESGDTVRALAEQLGVSPSRVHQLIQESKARTSKKAGAKRRPSSRQKGGST
jgi:hypothetical protein